MSGTHRTLFVAAGGGGDVLGAMMLAEALGSNVAGVASFAWERKMFDPHPGPRAPVDFARLRRVGVRNWQVLLSSHLRSGHSFLPRIAQQARAPLFLLDPSHGTVGLRGQLEELSVLTKVTNVVLVDVGGDIVATGREPGLRSPLADALVLAAADRLKNLQVVCLGMGLDGELPEAAIHSWLRAATHHGWGTPAPLPVKVATRCLTQFHWHPSEVTMLTCLAAMGYRGKAELRADGLTANLNSLSAQMWRFDYRSVLRRNRIAGAISSAESLLEVEDIVRSFRGGHSEIDQERHAIKLHRSRASEGADFAALEPVLLAYSDGARRRGIRYLTLRRVAEVLGLSRRGLAEFRQVLAQRQGTRVTPVWQCRQSHGSTFRRDAWRRQIRTMGHQIILSRRDISTAFRKPLEPSP